MPPRPKDSLEDGMYHRNTISAVTLAPAPRRPSHKSSTTTNIPTGPVSGCTCRMAGRALPTIARPILFGFGLSYMGRVPR